MMVLPGWQCQLLTELRSLAHIVVRIRLPSFAVIHGGLWWLVVIHVGSWWLVVACGSLWRMHENAFSSRPIAVFFLLNEVLIDNQVSARSVGVRVLSALRCDWPSGSLLIEFPGSAVLNPFAIL